MSHSGNPKIIEVYDFDWTLFRSPCSPPGYTGWYSRLESLTPPAVPRRPGNSWWIGYVVEKAKIASERDDTYVTVITGRRSKLHPRIHALIKRVGIKPDCIFCYDGKRRGEEYVIPFKVDSLEWLLQDNPYLEELVAYEDLPEQLDAYAELADQYGLKYKPHFVQTRIIEGLEWGC